jgi:hypothetical protein
MQVADEYVETLRLFLTDDDAFEQASRRLEHRDGEAGGNTYSALMAAVLRIAAQRYFGPTHKKSDVIQFVAHARAALQRTGGDDIDAGTAETILRALLGDPVMIGEEDKMIKAAALTAMLAVMVRDLGLSDEELGILLSQSRTLADRLLTG